jgi:hypothetical protein
MDLPIPDPMGLPVPDGLELMTDTTPANWIVEGLWAWGAARVLLGSFMPDGFGTYVRILHPTGPDDGLDSVSWGSLASMGGVTLGPETSFRDAIGDDPGGARFDHLVPGEGLLPPRQLRALVKQLRPYTVTP